MWGTLYLGWWSKRWLCRIKKKVACFSIFCYNNFVTFVYSWIMILSPRQKNIIILFFSSFSLISEKTFALCSGWFNFGDCEFKIPVGCESKDCLKDWVGIIGRVMKGLTNKPLSEYAQDVVLYFLSFISIIAVIYIIYAGFQILIGGGDEEKMKKAKNIILYVIVGIIVMWLAYAIVEWIMKLL